MKQWQHKIWRLWVGSLAFAPLIAHADTQQCEGLKAVSGATACDEKTLTDKIQNNVIDTLFVVVGAVAVIILIIGGIRYITSTGDSTRIQKAKDTILYAVIGLIVVILARAIVGFVIGRIG